MLGPRQHYTRQMNKRQRQHRHQHPYQTIKNRRKMEKETDILFTTPSAVRDEICLRENNNFVGATAGFGDDWEIIPRRSDRIPIGCICRSTVRF
jgi:hypothetical protein